MCNTYLTHARYNLAEYIHRGGGTRPPAGAARLGAAAAGRGEAGAGNESDNCVRK